MAGQGTANSLEGDSAVAAGFLVEAKVYGEPCKAPRLMPHGGIRAFGEGPMASVHAYGAPDL